MSLTLLRKKVRHMLSFLVISFRDTSKQLHFKAVELRIRGRRVSSAKKDKEAHAVLLESFHV